MGVVFTGLIPAWIGDIKKRLAALETKLAKQKLLNE